MHSSTTIGSEFIYCILHWWYPHDDMHLSLQWGLTTLMNASEAGQVECVKLLLDAGVQVNVQDNVSTVLFNNEYILGEMHTSFTTDA